MPSSRVCPCLSRAKPGVVFFFVLCGCGTSFGSANSTGDSGPDAIGPYVSRATRHGGRKPASDASPDGGTDAFVRDPTADPKTESCVISEAYAVFVAAPGPADGSLTDAAVVADGGADATGVDSGPTAANADSGSAADATGIGDAASSDAQIHDAQGDGALAESGVAGGDGTMAHPAATIGQGIALAVANRKSRVYVCAGGYAEQVILTSAVSLYGGFACPAGNGGRAWSYTGGLAQVISPVPAYALSVSGVSSSTVIVEDLSFETPAATAPGASSLAALIASSSIDLFSASPWWRGRGPRETPAPMGLQLRTTWGRPRQAALRSIRT